MVTMTRDLAVLENAPDEIKNCPKYDKYKRPRRVGAYNKRS